MGKVRKDKKHKPQQSKKVETKQRTNPTDFAMQKAEELAEKFSEIACLILGVCYFLIKYVGNNLTFTFESPKFSDRPMAFKFEDNFTNEPYGLMTLMLIVIGFYIFKWLGDDFTMLVASTLIVCDYSAVATMKSSPGFVMALISVVLALIFNYYSCYRNSAFSQKWYLFGILSVLCMTFGILLTPELLPAVIILACTYIQSVFRSLKSDKTGKVVMNAFISIVAFIVTAGIFALAISYKVGFTLIHIRQFNIDALIADFKRESIFSYTYIAGAIILIPFARFSKDLIYPLFVFITAISFVLSPIEADGESTPIRFTLMKLFAYVASAFVTVHQKSDYTHFLSLALGVAGALGRFVLDYLIKQQGTK